MIKINLLPEEFRVQVKSGKELPYLRLAIGGGAVFLLITAYLYIDFLAANSELKKAKQEFAIVEPQSRELTQLEQEVETVLKPEKEFMLKFVTSERPFTSLLAWASELLPDTAWLIEVNLQRDGDAGSILLKGLALPSKELSSIEQIEGYLHHYQEKIPEARLSLTTTRQKMFETELTQFTANFEWGNKKK